jgi:hypothetical protein
MARVRRLAAPIFEYRRSEYTLSWKRVRKAPHDAAVDVRRRTPATPFVGSTVEEPGNRNAICIFVFPAYVTTAPDASRKGAPPMIRYGFTIRARTGQRIENVSIIAGSQSDAERRLRQMYVQCEILECRERSIPRRFEAANLASMADLQLINPPTIQHLG